MNTNTTTSFNISGVSIPDSKLAHEVSEFIRDTESPLLFNHSSRVYYFGALAGKHRGIKVDSEMLYVGAMFHDVGLVPAYRSPGDRFEVDGANAARDFLRSRGINEADIDTVWNAIALHTTPGIPQHMHPVVALVSAGVEMDVVGIKYSTYSDAERNAVVASHPRESDFKNEIINAFYDGIQHKPDTTFGNIKSDVLALKNPNFKPTNFCSVILNSPWAN